MNSDTQAPIALAFTGASGMPYGLRLLECLLEAGENVALMISSAAQVVLAEETDLMVPGNPQKVQAFFCDQFDADPAKLQVYGQQQWSSPLASGSNAARAMVVCPCTSGCVSAIAQGASDNLIERAADVVLKEGRKLILVHRESPVSAIQLENLLKLARLGVCILPPNPGFYHKPQSIAELVDFIVARILDQLQVTHAISQRWG